LRSGAYSCEKGQYILGEADIIIAAEHATFFDPHTTYGMAAVFEPMMMLQRMPIGEVRYVAETIASQPPLAVQATVRAVWYAQQLGYRQALDVAKTLLALGTDEKSLAAGQRLFADGQRPQWRLR
jgi:enoyl-CoA hydratase/carnithine racemase